MSNTEDNTDKKPVKSAENTARKRNSTKKKAGKKKTTTKGQKVNTTTKSKELTIKQKRYIQAITDIDNKETLGNGTRSVMKAYNINNYGTAAGQSTALLKKPEVKEEITRILEEIGMSSKVRMSVLKSVALGETISKSTTSGITYDNNGTPHDYKTVTEQEPTARDRIAAINTIEKVAGTYDRNRAKADVMSSELKAAILRQKKDYTRTVNNSENDDK